MNCKICNNTATEIFTATVLKKFNNVQYFQCSNCNFIQTEHPYWLQESYTDAISDLDLGLISRNISLSQKMDVIINLFFDNKAKFIDYGGGYGMMVRMMRDKGYDFYRQDNFCNNLFAKHFDITDLTQNNRSGFELLTAFEVFEHLENPLEEIRKMFTYSKSVLFSTSLQPKKVLKSSDDWWYFLPEIGQHIAFYTEKSLQIVAEKFNTNYYKINDGLHLFSKNRINLKKIVIIEKSRILRFIYYFYYRYLYNQNHSLLSSDVNFIAGRNIFNN
jgi:hypothetical protein